MQRMKLSAALVFAGALLLSGCAADGGSGEAAADSCETVQSEVRDISNGAQNVLAAGGDPSEMTSALEGYSERAGELAEEAGIKGRVIGPLGTTTFRLRGQDIRVRYFLIEARRSVPRTEQRERKWFRHGAARKRLDFPEARKLLDKAVEKLEGK